MNAKSVVAINAIGSFDNGLHATVKLTGDRLVVGINSCALTVSAAAPSRRPR